MSLSIGGNGRLFYREHPLISRPTCSEFARLVVEENIMNKRETVQALMDAVQKGDLETAESMLADDFQFSGPIPEPLNKEAWLKMSSSLKTAFPDLDYHFRVIGAEGDVVRTTSQLSGTHSGSLDLTGMNMGVIPATNKSFSAKLEKTKVTVKENKITSWVVEPTEGAGLKAILGQLDVKPTTM
jgi:predicted ester cyclase